MGYSVSELVRNAQQLKLWQELTLHKESLSLRSHTDGGAGKLIQSWFKTFYKRQCLATHIYHIRGERKLGYCYVQYQ